MLRNNADARRCSYFELGLPVMQPSTTMMKIVAFLLAHSVFDELQYLKKP